MRSCAIPVAAVALLAGCGGHDQAAERAAAPPPPAPRSHPKPTPRPAPLTPARCAPGVAGCEVATGRIVYVEGVDPDGDGDAHFVVFGGNVTGRGLSVIDVRRELRPHPLPRIGDMVTAAGPVARGSHGQRQIEATEVRVKRR